MRMDPADSIIRKLGGYRTVARITGKHVTRVYSWTYPKEKGGTGGTIPMAVAIELLEHAQQAKLPLSAQDFLVQPGPAASRIREAV